MLSSKYTMMTQSLIPGLFPLRPTWVILTHSNAFFPYTRRSTQQADGQTWACRLHIIMEGCLLEGPPGAHSRDASISSTVCLLPCALYAITVDLTPQFTCSFRDELTGHSKA